MANFDEEEDDGFDPYKLSDEAESAVDALGADPFEDAKRGALVHAINSARAQRGEQPLAVPAGKADRSSDNPVGRELLRDTPNQATPESPRELPPPGDSNPYASIPDSRLLIARARQQSDQARQSALFMHAAETMSQGMTGRRSDHSFSDSIAEQADLPVKRALEDDALNRRQASQQVELGDYARRQRLRDPNSPESRQVRALFASTDLGSKLRDRMGADFNQIPAERIPGLGQQLALGLKSAPLEKLQLAKDMDDPTSDASKAAQDSAVELAKRNGNGGLSPEMEASIRKMPASFIRQSLVPRLNADAQRQFTEEENRRKEAAQKALTDQKAANARAAARAKALAKGSSGPDAELAVPGYELTGEVKPSKQEVSKLREALAGHEAAMDDLNQMRTLHQQYGAQPMPTNESARYKFLSNDLQLQLKAVEGLSRLNETELGMFAQMVPDPSRPQIALNDRTPAMLDQLESRVHGGLNAHAASLGYRRKQAQGASSTAPSGKVHVSNGKEAFYIDPKDLPFAKADDFQVVQ